MDVLWISQGFVFNTLIVAVLARRLLAAPTGWPRTIVLSALLAAGAAPLLASMSTAAGMVQHERGFHLDATGVFFILLASAWLLAIEIAVLAVCEALVPTGSLPSPVAFIRDIPGSWRRARRYAKILRIAISCGLGPYLRPSRRSNEPDHAIPQALRQALTKAGGVYIKLGQLLSTRADVLPPAFIAELSQLQATVPAADWAAIEPVITASLGDNLAAFEHIDRDAFAAASVAQVHRATLRNGQQVLLKVQRPGVRRQISVDCDIICRLARRLERATPWAKSLGVADIADGFQTSMAEEVDYRTELANLQTIGSTLETSQTSMVRVPVAYPHLCTDTVLVAECVDGQPLSAATEHIAALADEQRTELAGALFGCVVTQLVRHGTFHADLHPGNILIDSTNKLVLLDFGTVGRLASSARQALTNLLIGVQRQDSATVTDAFIELLDPPPEFDERRLERDLGEALLRFTGPGAGSTASMFGTLLSLVMSHGFAVPNQIATAFRSLGALEGSLQLLAPGIDLMELARQHAATISAELTSPTGIRQGLEAQLHAMLPVLARLPRRIDKLTADLESGRFSISMRIVKHPSDRAFLTFLVHQVVQAVLAVTAALGGILLITADNGPQISPHMTMYALFGFALLLVGFVLAARLMMQAFRNAADRDNGR